MTHQTEPLALLRDTEHYLSALHGSVARHDNLAANYGCAGCELRDRITAALPEITAAVSAAVTPPTTTTHGLSVQHADALWDAVAIPGPRTPTYPEQHERVCRAVREILDDLLPAPTDRAAVLREAIAAARQESERLSREMSGDAAYGARAVAKLLRRMADETATETPEPDSTTLLELVRDFLDPDPCSFDHHGYCQAHAAGFGGEPLSCPHGRARKMLAALEQPAAGARQDGAET